MSKLFRYIFGADVHKAPLLSLLLLIFLCSSFVVCYKIYSSSLAYILWIMTFLTIVFVQSKTKRESAVIMSTACIIIVCSLSTIFNGEDLRATVLVSSEIILAGMIAYKYSFDTFIEGFISLMRALCIISLIFFFVYLLFPQLNSVNVITNPNGVSASNMILYVHTGLFRNQSFFWEPGAFQSFVSMALLFELSREKPNMISVYLFIASVITTFSTTGYVCVVAIMLWYFLSGRGEAGIFVKICLGLIVLGGIAYVYAGDLLFSTSSHSTFGKLINVQDYGLERNGEATSASIRYYSVVKPFELFLEYPLFGCGYETLRQNLYFYTYGMNTCTFVNYFAVYGVLLGLFSMIGYYKFSRFLSKVWWEKLYLLVIFFLITATEDYVNNAFFYFPIVYGFTRQYSPNRLKFSSSRT